MPKKSWYKTQNNGDHFSVAIDDEIGTYGISAKAFMSDVKNYQGNEIHLDIHSYGGSVFDGIAMYHTLKNHKAKVITRIDGVAASAATLPYMAGDERHAPENTWLMIHNPWTLTAGDASDLRETADFLDRVKGNLTSIYHSATGMDESELSAMLDDETWLEPDEALSMGFATHVDESGKAVALSNDFAKHFSKLPKALNPSRTLDNAKPEDIETIKDLEKYLRDVGGFSASLSKSVVSKAKQVVRREGENDAQAALATLKNFSINS